MDTDAPDLPATLTPHHDLTGSRPRLPSVHEYTQKEVEQLRAQMTARAIEILNEPYSTEDDPDDLVGQPSYDVMVKRVRHIATNEKPDMRAVEWIQDNLVGKAVQRVESTNVTYNYQDLLKRTQEREESYQAVLAEVTDVTPAPPAPPPLPSWSRLL